MSYNLSLPVPAQKAQNMDLTSNLLTKKLCIRRSVCEEAQLHGGGY